MSELTSIRDNVFKVLHTEIFKLLGLKKIGLRSEISNGKLCRGFLCFPSRWNAPWVNSFQIIVAVTHEDYLKFSYPNLKYSGLISTHPPLAQVSLKKIVSPSDLEWSITPEFGKHDQDLLISQIKGVVAKYGLPLFQKFQSLEGVLEYLENQPNQRLSFQEHSWLLNFLGHHDKALELIKMSIDTAPHENARVYAERWLEKFKNG